MALGYREGTVARAPASTSGASGSVQSSSSPRRSVRGSPAISATNSLSTSPHRPIGSLLGPAITNAVRVGCQPSGGEGSTTRWKFSNRKRLPSTCANRAALIASSADRPNSTVKCSDSIGRSRTLSPPTPPRTFRARSDVGVSNTVPNSLKRWLPVPRTTLPHHASTSPGTSEGRSTDSSAASGLVIRIGCSSLARRKYASEINDAVQAS